MPGDYSVELYMVAGGEVSQLVKPVNFKATLLNKSSLPQADSKALVDYQAEVSELSRVMAGTRQMAREQQVKLNTIRKAIKQTPGTGSNMLIDVLELDDRLNNILYKLEGPSAKASWEELSPMEMPLNRRLNVMVRTHWSSTSELTKTETNQLEILKEEFPPLLAQLEKVVEEIRELDQQLEKLKAPWTPGRVPSLD
jgi:DNA-binding transcriptional regulator YhcF (GntR family)